MSRPGLSLIHSRRQTIVKVRALADEIDSISKDSKIAKITGASASILGTVVGVPLIITSVVLTGGAAAVPIGIAAAGFGGFAGAGGLTAAGAGIGGHLHIRAKYKEAMEALDKDRAHGQKFLELCKKAGKGVVSVGKGVVSAAGGGAAVFGKVGNTAGKVLKGAGNIATDATAIAKIGNVAKVAGGVGIAIGVILLPMDIYLLVKNSIDIHRRKRHAKAEELRSLARNLEESLSDLQEFVPAVDSPSV